MTARIHVAHIIYRLDIGGLENGVVNLINRMPDLRHSVVCLTDYTSFRERISARDVEVHALHRHPGKDLPAYARLWRLLRKLQPDIAHTRNLGTIDSQAIAWLAGVPGRVHSEHGRDIDDVDGTNQKHQRLRRALRPFVGHYIALSKDLERYLRDAIAVAPARLSQVYNGVDEHRFAPPAHGRAPLPEAGLNDPELFVIGTVGRMQGVKDQLTLVRAFIALVAMAPEYAARLRLAVIGAGPLQEQARLELARAQLAHQAWLPGARDDVPELMRGFDLFALPSLAEGISNTILEAMATSLPVVATRVGGNPELVEEGGTGTLVPANDPKALADALLEYVRDRSLARTHGQRGRERVVRQFSMQAMTDSYRRVYDLVLRRHGGLTRGAHSEVRESISA